MRLPKVTEGARVLLFDSLDDPAPHPTDPPRPKVLDRSGLRESVRRELNRLLNTRCSIPMHILSEQERSVVNYGIPDFSSLSPSNSEDQKMLMSIISNTIEAFEPRLRHLRMSVERYMETERALFIKFDAMLIVHSIIEPVSFEVYLQTKTGTMSIQAVEADQ